jgi:hypothetical protein
MVLKSKRVKSCKRRRVVTRKDGKLNKKSLETIAHNERCFKLAMRELSRKK